MPGVQLFARVPHGPARVGCYPWRHAAEPMTVPGAGINCRNIDCMDGVVVASYEGSQFATRR